MKLKPPRLRRLWIGIVLFTLLWAVAPMRYTALKVGVVLGIFSGFGLLTVVFPGRVWARSIGAIAATIIGCGIAFLALPGRPYDVAALRAAYVRSLLSYQGTYYVWGGGNHLGIDCSGLVQSALVEACLAQAVETANPELARDAVSLWWHNRSARAIGDGYRGETLLMREVPSLNAADYAAIEPGDLAVLSDGVHVLAFVGSRTWIEADPIPMRVILASAPRQADYYFGAPVRIMRWRVLVRPAE